MASFRDHPSPNWPDQPSPNWNERPGPIDSLVLHYTGMTSGEAAAARLCDPVAQVSAHYVLHEDGRIQQLVPDLKRAWHAGVSSWEGRAGLNDGSIGIEIVNPGHAHGLRPFADRQIGALIELCGDLLARHRIHATRVVGHSDIAPARKLDPGELFPWRRLAGAGIGLWTDDGTALAPEMAAAQAMLAGCGYPVDNPYRAIAAFQRRFRPWRVDGRLDHETMGRLAAVEALYRDARGSR